MHSCIDCTYTCLHTCMHTYIVAHAFIIIRGHFPGEWTLFLVLTACVSVGTEVLQAFFLLLRGVSVYMFSACMEFCVLTRVQVYIKCFSIALCPFLFFEVPEPGHPRTLLSPAPRHALCVLAFIRGAGDGTRSWRCCYTALPLSPLPAGFLGFLFFFSLWCCVLETGSPVGH